eukprot:Plantae.Rhodophyta-Palmaria_palmata.ctg5242.p1 GENE.Plantae.Rhodophyta-Palmaria_palmata.ctg5242~~Plantae.Rhodophyta-Palmaria_palmata.ctg5242.p1  ORF type:complete len:424 (-),score=78.42 Plantae.Rhodophyta-Palmaria_palmata.ctg5242:554-1825(-)
MTSAFFGAWSVERAPQGKGARKVALIFFFSVIYRAFTQASPIVPMVIDAASHRTKGTEESSLARIKIGVSWWYLWNRVGILGALLVLALLPNRSVENLLLPYAVATFIFFVTIAFTAISMPTTHLGGMETQMQDGSGQVVATDVEKPHVGEGQPDDTFDGMTPQSPPPSPPQPSIRLTVVSDLKAVLFRASRPLNFLFLQTFLFGLMNGLLRIIVAPYFNEIQQKYNPMDSTGVEWMSYSGLLSLAVGLWHDALIGILAFSSAVRSFGVTLFWVLELLIGSALFVALYFVRTQLVAFLVFSSIAIAISSQGFFNLVATGALPPHPRLRTLTFGIRAASLHSGELVGSLIAAILERKNENDGFRRLMLFCAIALGASALAAIGVGTPEIPRFSDLPVNANPLLAFLRNKDDEDIFVRKITEKAE